MANVLSSKDIYQPHTAGSLKAGGSRFGERSHNKKLRLPFFDLLLCYPQHALCLHAYSIMFARWQLWCLLQVY